MRWTFLVDPAGRPGRDNMAIDQALLDLAAGEGRGFLRLYRWDPPCLSFGRHEPALTRYDREAIERLGLDVVRRPTGGRAVWHADELTYAVAAPLDTFGTLQQTYHRIHKSLAGALQALGFDATLAGMPLRRSGVDAGACFASPVGGEVLLGGRKAVGSAQLREGGAFLQHGSILLGGTQKLVGTITSGRAPSDGSISLAVARGQPVPFDELAGAVIEQTRAWGTDWEETSSQAASIQAAASRWMARFTSDDWTWQR